MISITIPETVSLEALPLESLFRLVVYCKRGGTRRQDHGTRGNGKTNRDRYGKIAASKRRDFRASGCF